MFVKVQSGYLQICVKLWHLYEHFSKVYQTIKLVPRGLIRFYRASCNINKKNINTLKRDLLKGVAIITLIFAAWVDLQSFAEYGID